MIIRDQDRDTRFLRRRLNLAIGLLSAISQVLPTSRLYGQRNGDLGAFAAPAADRQVPAHLFDALAHSGQTKTIMSRFDFESVAVIAKFQTKFFCIEDQPRFKIARMRVFECVGQGFLSDVQQIFLPIPTGDFAFCHED